jgi:tRNA nucleotidyltransferase (CCA-adding enzyme)
MNSDVEVVLRGIKAAGGYAVIVGGSVRDQVMGLGSKDVDIEVYFLSPEQLQGALERVASVTEAGKSFGVFKVRSGMTDIDVSLPRTDSKVGPGHRGFEVKVDSRLDLRSACKRRDFTMNALMLDPDSGTIFDFHDGLGDIARRCIRHVDDATFGDDPLRVLRAIQFVARLGFWIHPFTVDVCFPLKDRYTELSKERVWTEWEKIGTKGIHIHKALDALLDTDWIGLFPELVLCSGFRANATASRADQCKIKGEDRLVLVFAALLDGLGTKLVVSFLERIGCPAKIQARIIPLVSYSDAFDEYPTRPAVLKLARALYPASIQELHLIKPSNRWIIQAMRFYVSQRPEKPLLTGDILIDCGFTPGPQFKVMLKTALDAQDNCEFITEMAAISWLSANYG